MLFLDRLTLAGFGVDSWSSGDLFGLSLLGLALGGGVEALGDGGDSDSGEGLILDLLRAGAFPDGSSGDGSEGGAFPDG